MDYMSITEKCNLEMDLKILNIICHPGDVLIRFQGKYISDSEFDYHILQKEIQLVAKIIEDIDVGQFCLVEEKPCGMWHRGKILDKVNQKFEVLLIDQGNVLKVPSSQIASATGELFILPPKVVKGIISNLLPLEEKWNSRAVNYFSSLAGQQLHGNVKTFLPHQVILLEIPKVITYAIELCLARYVDSESFCLLVEILHKFPANSHGKQMPDLLQQKEISSDVTFAIPDSLPSFQKLIDHLRPELCFGTIEKIKISAAVSPDRFFCRILSWETELNKLTASMCSYYETAITGESSILGTFGVLCAAKRKDGLWYRGVIQKLISCNDVKIWFIDIGSSETVPSSTVQKLQSEFLSSPMMAIPCALSRDNDYIESVRNVQFALFKEALTGHVVIGHIEDFRSEERLYYISLFPKDFEFSADCHLTNKPMPLLSPYSSTDASKPAIVEKSQNLSLPETFTSLEMEYSDTVSYTSVKMNLESVHLTYVEYVINPSNFWIRIDDCKKDYTVMMAELAEKYNKCDLMDMVLQNPQPGQLCCALYALDGHYYRAVVTEILSSQISVYFIDFGNTETIPFYDVKVLLPQFSVLPALAICCSLAYAYPIEDVWDKSANDFFKEIVSGKDLLCHVLAKQKCKYVVEMRLSDSSSSSDIVHLLVQAGFAEFWKVDLNANSLNVNCPSPDSYTKNKKNGKGKKICERISKEVRVSLSALAMKQDLTEQKFSLCTPDNNFAICYKHHIFKPGAVMDVICSHVDSPASFWCQVSGNISKLCTLMDEMQNFYTCCTSGYQHGRGACAAKSSVTGKYYRAAVLKYFSPHEVQVIYIDYGKTETLLISDLREMKPQFLKLEGQAFRCCLSQSFSPPYLCYEWSANACEDFRKLVQSTPNKIKCTVVALFSSGSEDLCNAVNLDTPFGNANKILMDKGHLVLRNHVPAHLLHTFCYSSFDLKVGSKEDVYVTFVYNTGRFYCQLAKNEKNFDMLMEKVAEVVDQLRPVRKPNEACLVKYLEDDNFYRAVSCPLESSPLFMAFFVDFGDSQMVKKSEMLHIPEEAFDILFQPMQAIPCYLAGMKESILTVEAKAWFAENFVGKLLSAVVVAKDNEGQLELELYYENGSISKEIQQLFRIKPITSNDNLNIYVDSSTVRNQHGSHSLDSLPINILQKNSSHVTKCIDTIYHQTHSGFQKRVKAVDLPQMVVEDNTTCLAYASHIDSPCSFFVHFGEQLEKTIQLTEELNKMSFQVIGKQDMEISLVVVAQYPEDMAYYRAEIKGILEESLCVEFIDYGNVANVDSSCVFTLPEKFLTIPRLSCPVFLTGVHKLQSHTEWSRNVTKMFSDKIKSEQFNCKFIRKHDIQWEVDITLEGKSLSEELTKSFQCFFKLPAEVSQDSLPESDDSYLNISNRSPREDTTADKYIHRPHTRTLKPGLIEKVKNICLSDFGTLFVTLANFPEESELNSHIAAAVKEDGNQALVADLSEGMVCLAKSERMQVWLRASIEKLIPSTKEMAVFFVDNGARETISMNNTKMLSMEALSIPMQAIFCKWPVMEKKYETLFKAQLKSILQKEIQVVFLEYFESISTWKVELLVDGTLLLQYLHSVESSVDFKLDGTKFQSEANVLSKIPRKNIKPLQVCPGFVTSFNNPSSFFVQMGDSLSMMDTLSQLMQIPDDLTPIDSDLLRLGTKCLVQSFDKQEWCRAEIRNLNRDGILLDLLDHGIDKIIPYSEYVELKMVPSEMSCLPALTYHCTLSGVTPIDGNCWSKAAVRYCTSFVKDRNLLILPIHHLDNNILEVSVYGQGDLAFNLIKKGFAKKQIDNSSSI